jgi:hypothetical protein
MRDASLAHTGVFLFDALDLEDYRPEPVSATGNFNSLVPHTREVASSSDPGNYMPDVRPGPGTETLGRLIDLIHDKLLTIVEDIAGSHVSTVNVDELLDQIMVEATPDHRNPAL